MGGGKGAGEELGVNGWVWERGWVGSVGEGGQVCEGWLGLGKEVVWVSHTPHCHRVLCTILTDASSFRKASRSGVV